MTIKICSDFIIAYEEAPQHIEFDNSNLRGLFFHEESCDDISILNSSLSDDDDDDSTIFSFQDSEDDHAMDCYWQDIDFPSSNRVKNRRPTPHRLEELRQELENDACLFARLSRRERRGTRQSRVSQEYHEELTEDDDSICLNFKRLSRTTRVQEISSEDDYDWHQDDRLFDRDSVGLSREIYVLELNDATTSAIKL